MAVRAERKTEIDIATPLKSAVDRIAQGADHVDILVGGEPVAVVVSVDDYRRYRRREEAARKELHDLSVQISRAFADVPSDELDRELEKARLEYRAERKAERDAAAGR